MCIDGRTKSCSVQHQKTNFWLKIYSDFIITCLSLDHRYILNVLDSTLCDIYENVKINKKDTIVTSTKPPKL